MIGSSKGLGKKSVTINTEIEPVKIDNTRQIHQIEENRVHQSVDSQWIPFIIILIRRKVVKKWSSHKSDRRSAETYEMWTLAQMFGADRVIQTATYSEEPPLKNKP